MSTQPTAAPIADMDALIERCLTGDQAAWDQIVRQHWRKVFNLAYKFVGRHDEAEDLAQDIFLKIFKSLGTFDSRANFQTWLISVSRNLCIDHYRSVRKERETIDRSVDSSMLMPVSKTQGQMAMMEQHDRVELLREAMGTLPKTLRTAVLMRDIQELSYQEIADKLRLPEGTVKSRINRGRDSASLRHWLSRAPPKPLSHLPGSLSESNPGSLLASAEDTHRERVEIRNTL